MTLIRTRSDHRIWIVFSLLILLCVGREALAQTAATTKGPTTKGTATQPAAGSTTPVAGSGTPGQVTKWMTTNAVGDSIISEDKFGKVGIGTNTPASKLTVAGVIESTSGGVMFPDGTVQATAAVTTAGLTSVRDVDNPARQPFQFSLLAVAPNNQFTVPSGKRLVIEYVSGRLSVSLGQQLESVFLFTKVNNVSVDHYFTPILTGGVTQSIFTVSQQTRIYADPGTVIKLFTLGAVTEFGDLTISGYFVDLQ